MHSMSDPSRIPARVLDLLASVTGHKSSLHAAPGARRRLAPRFMVSALSFAPTERVRPAPEELGGAATASDRDLQRALADC